MSTTTRTERTARGVARNVRREAGRGADGDGRVQKTLSVTSMVVTHDLKTTSPVSDRVAFLYGGRVAFVGTVAELRATHTAAVRSFIDAA
jgi:ABC-type Fe3+/spermidine/putrescine transport system ATPase subunit